MVVKQMKMLILTLTLPVRSPWFTTVRLITLMSYAVNFKTRDMSLQAKPILK